jgi:hypothetical protein
MSQPTPRRRRKPAAPTTAPPPYVPSPAFALAYAAPHNELGPILTRWEGNRAVWLLETNQAGRRRADNN